VTEPRDANQMFSDACTCYAASYYHETLRPDKWFSRRDLFAPIALTYGAFIRDAILRIVKIGQSTQDQVPDPAMPDRTNMRDTTGLDPNKEAPNRELDGFSMGNDIDTVASTIRDYQGCEFGLNVSNAGWQDEINPRPPLSGEKTTGHALYGMGYHLHDGIKCIIAKSSYGRADGSKEGAHHHIKENYFTTGNTFSPWTLIPRVITFPPMDLSQYQYHLVQDAEQTGSFGIVLDNQIRVASAARLPELLATYLLRGSKGVTPLNAVSWNAAVKIDI
jgi:hypothetical protein